MIEHCTHLTDPQTDDGDNQPNPTIKPYIKDMVAGLISENLKNAWVEEEPTERCFDYDETQMDSLLSFVEARHMGSEGDSVRDHLLKCPRCRYLYARTREASMSRARPWANPPAKSSTQQDPIPELLRTQLRSTGPVIFPGNEISDGAWEFGLLGEIEPDIAERISEEVAERGWRKLRGLVPKEGVVVVCFGNPVHRCGKRLAVKMTNSGVKDVHVVMADDFFNPKLWCDPKELNGRSVVVFLDVVHTGGLLNRLVTVCRQGDPSALTAMAIIDQSSGDVSKVPLVGLWEERKEKRGLFAESITGGERYFDPVAGRARLGQDLPSEVSDLDKARATIESRLIELRPIARYIQVTGALRQDACIGGVSYPWALDLLCLLSSDEARAELSRRAAVCLSDLVERGPWCLVFPAVRHQRAGAWAELLADKFGWPIVKVGLKKHLHYRPLTSAQRSAVAGHPRALIVDAAIRSGTTMQSLVSLLRPEGQPDRLEIAAFYAIDGLFDASREVLQGSLSVEIRSLFRLPLGAPTESVGRYCRKWLNTTLREVETSGTSQQAPWANVVLDYCRKKLESSGRPLKQRSPEELERVLRRALDEGERGARACLESSCDPPRSSVVKHLDVTYALREPRTRNVLHGFMCNSMPADFIESCALALATQQDYDWFDRDWLILHKRLLTNASSQRWQFLACVSYWIRRHGDREQIERVRSAVDEFRRSQSLTLVPMFQDIHVDENGHNVLQSRCRTLTSVLATD